MTESALSEDDVFAQWANWMKGFRKDLADDDKYPRLMESSRASLQKAAAQVGNAFETILAIPHVEREQSDYVALLSNVSLLVGALGAAKEVANNLILAPLRKNLEQWIKDMEKLHDINLPRSGPRGRDINR